MGSVNVPRHYNLRLALLGLVFAVVAVVCFRGEEQLAEPMYEGRPMRYWLRQMSDPRADEASIRRAFREMGPEAAPLLLHLAKETDGVWKRSYVRCYELAPGVIRRVMPVPETAGLRRQHCQWGLHLSVSGPKGVRDARYLVAALASPFTRDRLTIVNLMGSLGPSSKVATQALMQALKDPDARVRRQAALMLFHVDPTSAMGVPQLIETLTASSALLRSDAALALGRIGSRDPRVIVALQLALKDPSEYVRQEASEALGRLGGGRSD